MKIQEGQALVNKSKQIINNTSASKEDKLKALNMAETGANKMLEGAGLLEEAAKHYQQSTNLVNQAVVLLPQIQEEHRDFCSRQHCIQLRYVASARPAV